MSQVRIQTPIETVAASENDTEYYTGALASVTYHAVGGKAVSKKKEKDLINIIDDAITDGSIDVFKEAVSTFGIQAFGVKAINNLIKEREEGDTDKKALDVREALGAAGYTVVLDEDDSRIRYYIGENKRTGTNASFKKIRKDGDESLIRYAISKNVGEKFVVERNIDTVPSAIIEFDPEQDDIYQKEGKTYFNTWTAPSLACIEKDTIHMYEPELYPLLDTLLMNVVGNDRGAYTYLMNVLSKSYQTKKSMTNIISLTGMQGTGKGVLHTLLKQIYTDAHVGAGGVKHNIFSDSDNSLLKDKLIYVLDEVAIGEEEFYTDAKTMAGNNSFTLKSLNRNSEVYPNRALFLNFFNLRNEDEIAFSPDANDRRISIIDSWTSLMNAEHFRDYTVMSDAVDQFELSSGSGIVEYFAWMLATMDIDEKLIKNPYDNELRRRWIDAGIDNTEDFYTAVINSDITYFENKADGVMYNGFGVIDTIIRMFSGAFEFRVTELSNIFEAMFLEKENKAKRNIIMEGKKTRSDGDKGSFIYKIAPRPSNNDALVAMNSTIPKPIEGYMHV